MASEHTKAPWTYQRAMNYEGFSIAPQGTVVTLAAVQFCHGPAVTIECHNFPGETEANARRIVACVNVLEGISTEEIEQGVLRNVIVKIAEELERFKYRRPKPDSVPAP
jgi:hypothetical protein